MRRPQNRRFFQFFLPSQNIWTLLWRRFSYFLISRGQKKGAGFFPWKTNDKKKIVCFEMKIDRSEIFKSISYSLHDFVCFLRKFRLGSPLHVTYETIQTMPRPYPRPIMGRNRCFFFSICLWTMLRKVMYLTKGKFIFKKERCN